MVLRDEADERLRQLVLVGDVDAAGHVPGDDRGRLLGRQQVVDVLAGLVLDERLRVVQLADVVVVGGDARDERVGVDGLGRLLREVADHQRVVVRAGRLHEQAPEQGLLRVGELEQLVRGR